MNIYKILSQISIPAEDLELPQGEASSDTVLVAVQIAFAVLGAFAFFMIVLSGLRYTLSRGNSDALAKARNGIIYSAVGLVVSMLAFSIVRFVIRSV